MLENRNVLFHFLIGCHPLMEIGEKLFLNGEKLFLLACTKLFQTKIL